MSESLVIDPQAIENLRALTPDDNDEFLREIIGIFLEDTPLRVVELEQSLAAGDLGKFTRAAHSIKGSSANVGAVALRAVAERIEHEARKTGLPATADSISQVKLEFARSRDAFGQLLPPR